MDPTLVALCVTPVAFRAALPPTTPKGGKTWGGPSATVDAYLERLATRHQAVGVETKLHDGKAWLPPERYQAAGRPITGDKIVLPDGTEQLLIGMAVWMDPELGGVVDHYELTFGAS